MHDSANALNIINNSAKDAVKTQTPWKGLKTRAHAHTHTHTHTQHTLTLTHTI